jgi:methylmalonyl-CoA mutase N-terminal domain/subunit
MPVVCTPDDVAALESTSDGAESAGAPGARGRGRASGTPWTIYQSLGVGAPADAHVRALRLVEAGATGLVVPFDRPTLAGLDSDDARASMAIGTEGLSIATVADMCAVIDGVDLGSVALALPAGSTAPMLLALLLVAAEQRGASWASLAGMTECAVLGEVGADASPAWPPACSLRLSSDLVAFCAEYLPQWSAVTVGGYRLREAGVDAQQELSCSLAAAFRHLRAAVAAGVDVERACGHVAVCFSAHDNLFEEIAKLRAARQVWPRLLRESFELQRDVALDLHVRTSLTSLTAEEPWDNVTRVTCQALAAASGGACSLFTRALDHAVGGESLDAAVLAVRTQQVLANESGLAGEPDPFAGAWLVERLTRDFVLQTERDIAEIDVRDDMAPVLQRAASIGGERRANAGVGGQAHEPRRDDSAAVRRAAQLRTYREQRDAGAVNAALADLKSTVAGRGNTMAQFVACARAGVTLGEMTAAVATTVTRPTVP